MPIPLDTEIEFFPDDDDLSDFSEGRVVPEVFDKEHGTDVSEYEYDFSLNEQDDFTQARDNMKNLISVANEATESLADHLKVYRDPQLYSALSGMLKTQQSLNKGMIDLHKAGQDLLKSKRLNKKESSRDNTSVDIDSVQKVSGPTIIHTSTTSDLLKEIKE